jgi:hypothetical protein
MKVILRQIYLYDFHISKLNDSSKLFMIYILIVCLTQIKTTSDPNRREYALNHPPPTHTQIHRLRHSPIVT